VCRGGEVIRHNEGIKRRLVRQETRGVDMSTYGIEELRWILASDLDRCHCHAFFLLKGKVEFCGVLQVLFIELTPGTSIRIQDMFPECHPDSRYD
jgi:hypothetical protein